MVWSRDSVPVRENGEPLVDLRQACPELRFATQRPYYARRSVAERLAQAQAWLNAEQPGYILRIGDAYRSVEKQARFFRIMCRMVRILRPFWPETRVRAAADRYVAAPDALIPPPHTTGGAVDVGLIQPNGKRAYMGPWRVAATRADYAKLTSEAQGNRARLAAAMQHAGFTNYPEEWWHWSYGDSIWALQTGHAFAIYGTVSCIE